MKPRLLIVRSSAHFGGVERYLLSLAEHMEGCGWQVNLVFLYRGKDAAEHPAAIAARKRGLSSVTFTDRGLWDPNPARALYEFTRRLCPNVIHTQDYKSDVLAALLRPRLHVATAHGFTDADRRQRIYKWLDMLVLRHLPAVVVPSSFQARMIARAGVPRRRIIVIPPIPDWDDLMLRASSPLPTQAQADPKAERVLTFIGRTSPEKGGDILLAAFARIVTSCAAARLWILGDGPARRHWLRTAQGLGITARVRFWGWRDDAPAFVRQSTFVVIPSRRETFGLAGLEAQGLGVPVIASRVGALPDTLFEEGVMWISPGHVDALAETIIKALERAGEWHRRAQDLAPRVRAAFPHHETLIAHEALYRQQLCTC